MENEHLAKENEELKERICFLELILDANNDASRKLIDSNKKLLDYMKKYYPKKSSTD